MPGLVITAHIRDYGSIRYRVSDSDRRLDSTEKVRLARQGPDHMLSERRRAEDGGPRKGMRGLGKVRKVGSPRGGDYEHAPSVLRDPVVSSLEDSEPRTV